ncbi:MAG: hypothetical protein QY310_09600 [Candidatus Jettenia sp. CY-1]|nr:MAG: hypothetical protein QY310_09600 [Candidatus Jettenia sp. CY-1]
MIKGLKNAEPMHGENLIVLSHPSTPPKIGIQPGKEPVQRLPTADKNDVKNFTGRDWKRS